MTTRGRILHWGGWFSVGNTALLAIVGLRYLWYYSPLEPSIGWVYAGVAYLGHLGALAFLPFLVLVPVTLFFRDRGRSCRSPSSWRALFSASWCSTASCSPTIVTTSAY